MSSLVIPDARTFASQNLKVHLGKRHDLTTLRTSVRLKGKAPNPWHGGKQVWAIHWGCGGDLDTDLTTLWYGPGSPQTHLAN